MRPINARIQQRGLIKFANGQNNDRKANYMTISVNLTQSYFNPFHNFAFAIIRCARPFTYFRQAARASFAISIAIYGTYIHAWRFYR